MVYANECLTALISNLLSSKISNSEHARVAPVFTTRWTTMRVRGAAGLASSLTPKAFKQQASSPRTPHLLYHSRLCSNMSRHCNWMVMSWYDSWWVRNTDWSISRGWEGRLQAWHHAGVHSESSLLAEMSRGLSTFLFSFPRTGVCVRVCLSSVITIMVLPGTLPQHFLLALTELHPELKLQRLHFVLPSPQLIETTESTD